MKRRRFCKLLAASAGLNLNVRGALGLKRLASTSNHPDNPIDPSSSTRNDYANSRAPLSKTAYVRLPLGAIQPQGWLRDQLWIQKNGLTSHLGELWDVLKQSAWKGDAEANVLPECCTARFVPRWLEGLTLLSGVMHDEHLKALAEPYMRYILDVQNPATITPSVCAWSHLGRFLPDYYELTGDERAIKLVRRILDYADSVRNSSDKAVVEPTRLGMLLYFGHWYYNRTGDRDVLPLLERCTTSCVDDWKNYFVGFPKDPKYFVHFPDQTSEKPHLKPSEWTRQGVDVTQAIQYPVQHYLMSGDRSDAESAITGMNNLDQGYGQVGGRWSGDEWLANTDPTQGTELCQVEELLFSLEKNVEILGKIAFADRMEQLIYNSFPGTCTPDMWAHQYDQQANQVLVTVAERHWHWNIDNSNIYGFTPNFPCCLANMHSPWPRFVQAMWMATPDRGFAAVAYGPCKVSAVAAEGTKVEIAQETEYPFSDRVRITVHVDQPASFPIYLRIPTWANSAEVSVSGETGSRRPQSGTFLRLERLWHSGDVVTLNFNFKVRCETRKNHSVAVAWGPLYFVLRIGESFKKLPGLTAGGSDTIIPSPPGTANWQITPTTDWNYALAIDRAQPRVHIIRGPVSSMPFAQKGEMVKEPGASEFAPWREDVPMILRVAARKVPSWGLVGASAGPVPVSPVKTDSPETMVELVPYGCSRLRIAEFPTTPPL